MPDRWTGPTAAQRRAQTKIATALAGIGMCLPGSVATRSYPCGKPNCACHADPPRLHGPYIQWTRQVGGKTVHTNLSEQQLADYQQLFDNAQRLRDLVDQLEKLTLQAIRADQNPQR
ncbi:MAG: hypothetical protein M3063_05275 [Actinomycetota bacterium]|nr:hypothetical protein [Actinomycetota bacterium]